MGDIGRADGIVVGGAKRPVELVELVVFDEESKPARARRNTEKLIEDGAVILFGPYGSAAGRAVASLAHERGVLVWNHGAAAGDVARAGVITLHTRQRVLRQGRRVRLGPRMHIGCPSRGRHAEGYKKPNRTSELRSFSSNKPEQPSLF